MRIDAGLYLYLSNNGEQLYAIVCWYGYHSAVRFFNLDCTSASGPGAPTKMLSVSVALKFGRFIPLVPDGSERVSCNDMGLKEFVKPKTRQEYVQPYFECVDSESGYCILRSHSENIEQL